MDRFDEMARRATYDAALRVFGRYPTPDDYVPVIAKHLREAHKLGIDEGNFDAETAMFTLRAELAAARAEVDRVTKERDEACVQMHAAGARADNAERRERHLKAELERLNAQHAEVIARYRSEADEATAREGRLRAALYRERNELVRPDGCECQWEAGDSPCPLHGENEEHSR